MTYTSESAIVLKDGIRRMKMRQLIALADKLGVEDIEPREVVYAVEAFEARGETPEQVAKFLGWTKS